MAGFTRTTLLLSKIVPTYAGPLRGIFEAKSGEDGFEAASRSVLGEGIPRHCPTLRRDCRIWRVGCLWRPSQEDCDEQSGSESSCAALEPERPDGVYAGVGDGRGGYSPLLAPGPSVENPGDACQHNITPVEVRRTFIEMREPEQNRSDHQRCPASHAPFQQILHPGAKKEFLGNSDGESPEPALLREPRAKSMPVRATRFSSHSSGNESQSRCR